MADFEYDDAGRLVLEHSGSHDGENLWWDTTTTYARHDARDRPGLYEHLVQGRYAPGEPVEAEASGHVALQYRDVGVTVTVTGRSDSDQTWAHQTETDAEGRLVRWTIDVHDDGVVDLEHLIEHDDGAGVLRVRSRRSSDGASWIHAVARGRCEPPRAPSFVPSPDGLPSADRLRARLIYVSPFQPGIH